MKDIKQQIESGIVTMGVETTLKSLRSGKLEEVYITSNCPKEKVSLFEKYSDTVKINKVPQTNAEMGVLCKKPFAISVLGVLKQK